jgi:Undecaprenyl-phosphate glucose phosphotransferase
MLLDVVAIVTAGLIIYFTYLDLPPDALVRYGTVLVTAALLIVQSSYIAGLYRFNAIITPGQQIGKIISISTTVFLVLVAVGFALKISDDYSRVWLFATAAGSIVAMGAGRYCFLALIRRMAIKGYLARKIVVYGATDQAQRFISHLSGLNAPWNKVIGIFDDRHSAADVEMEGVSVRGNLQDLVQYARDTSADDIVVALPWGDQTRISQIIQQLKVLPTNIRLSPDLASLRILSGTINYQYGIPLASIYEKPLSTWHNIEKRLFDLCVSSAMLLMLAPLMLILIVGVKLDSPGPAFFRQRRYGFNNQLIKIWKFRTMYVEQQDEKAERLATPNDPRVTRLGSFLRKTSLDELPQLFNVIAGDMSLVGPRPHALRAKAAGQLYQDAVGEYAARHRVKPGLTGWAQVNGWRGETDTHEKIVKRVEHDLYYIENWSIRLDIRILFRTLGVLVNQKNAY